MIWQLMRRDLAWKITPWLTAAAGVAAFLCSVKRADSFFAGMASPIYLIAFLRAVPHQRATFFEAALPVSGRDLWLARLLSLLSMTWLPVIAAGVALALNGYGAATIASIGTIATALTLGVVTILSVRVQQFSGPAWLTVAYPTVAAALMVPAFVYGHAAPAGVICAAAAAVIGIQTWKRVPEAFQCAPPAVERERNKAGSAAPSLPWWPMIRSVFTWQTAVFLPISLIWIATGDCIYGSLYLMIAYNQMRLSTGWALALPVSRRAMLAAMMGPLLFVVAAGGEAGMLAGFAKQGKDLIRQGDPDHFRAAGTLDVFVDRAFWKPAPDGRPPLVQAPWGETFQPDPERILGATIYNPYAVGEHNSRQFEEWQFARATADIYGVAVTPREMAEGKLRGVTPITLRPRMQILTVAAALALALLWIWLVELFSWHRLGRLSSTVRNTITYAAMSIFLFAVMGLDLGIGRKMGRISQPALEAGLLALSRSLPSDLATLSALALLPLLALLWIVDRQSAAAEVSQKMVENQTLFARLGGRP